MSYRPAFPTFPVSEGRVITDSKPLKGVFAHDFPLLEFIQFTNPSPAQLPAGNKYQGFEYLINTYVVFKAYNIEVYRENIRSTKQAVTIPPEVSAHLRAIFIDGGSNPETESTFSIEYYAPIGTGVYWFSRAMQFYLP